MEVDPVDVVVGHAGLGRPAALGARRRRPCTRGQPDASGEVQGLLLALPRERAPADQLAVGEQRAVAAVAQQRPEDQRPRLVAVELERRQQLDVLESRPRSSRAAARARPRRSPRCPITPGSTGVPSIRWSIEERLPRRVELGQRRVSLPSRRSRPRSGRSSARCGSPSAAIAAPGSSAARRVALGREHAQRAGDRHLAAAAGGRRARVARRDADLRRQHVDPGQPPSSSGSSRGWPCRCPPRRSSRSRSPRVAPSARRCEMLLHSRSLAAL